MTDYKKIGFKCGVEIHQQLDTHKLFCNCPSIVHDNNPDIRIERRLRAVVGETGEIDGAAAAEFKHQKKNIYEACSSSCCLVELDEEPPLPVNKEALEIAITIATLMNAKLVDEIEFMRKTVVDGSNVSGFQRTALIATDGYIDTSKGKVSIPMICLEEEAAKRIRDDKTDHETNYETDHDRVHDRENAKEMAINSKTKDVVRWRLDRLGIALVEVSTGPDIVDPDHAKETAQKIGMILRSTGKVKRGIGTIRQDVNVSIKGGSRVEIKGFQDLKSIPSVIDGEILRQKKIIAKKQKVPMEVRAANADGTTRFMRPMPGAARLYPETDVLPVFPKKSVAKVELIDEKIKRYKKLGLAKDLATLIAKQKAELFDKMTSMLKNIRPTFCAEIIVPKIREISRKHKSVDVGRIDDDFLFEVLSMLDSKKITAGAIEEILVLKGKGKKVDYSKFEPISKKEILGVIDKVKKDMDGAPIGAIIGKVMAELKGRADGKVVAELIKNN